MTSPTMAPVLLEPEDEEDEDGEADEVVLESVTPVSTAIQTCYVLRRANLWVSQQLYFAMSRCPISLINTVGCDIVLDHLRRTVRRCVRVVGILPNHLSKIEDPDILWPWIRCVVLKRGCSAVRDYLSLSSDLISMYSSCIARCI